ncbi:hypothetical protein SBA1_480084 [Candidatus Sulfotelmatobacter kueseliae]|uniref:Uncharacterized protein n=1 Tax=Candidatus Sulfotelmatobacter kueseliae TaxID=2042962 RepID=A0A2U3KU81_9BACT|nr:hypothetical protein SBA1_480084 [Candidatus Sulfotelmatobacter kueseliae]
MRQLSSNHAAMLNASPALLFVTGFKAYLPCSGGCVSPFLKRRLSGRRGGQNSNRALN